MSSTAPAVCLIGLGRGALTLGRQLTRMRGNFRVVGYDDEPDRMAEALAAGAVHEVQLRLDRALEGTRLVILGQPPDQLIDFLARLGEMLEPGVVVTDIAVEKERILEAARRALPEGVSFIGGHPIVRDSQTGAPPPGRNQRVAKGQSKTASPQGGTASASGMAVDEDASPNPYAGMPYCLIPLPTAAPEAVETMVSLVKALGAQPLFIGAAEHDGLIVGAQLLPRLVALAQLGIAGRSASLLDLERLAGSGLQFALEPGDHEEAAILQAVQANPHEVLSWLDQLLVELGALKAELQSGEAGRLAAWIADSEPGRARWRAAAGAPSETERPFQLMEAVRETQGGFFGRIGLGPRKRATPDQP